MYHVYTDGGSRGNPGHGAWAFAVYSEQGVQKYYKGSKSMALDHTTNNQAEMLAVIEAAKWSVKAGLDSVDIYTDSAYVQNGMTSWMRGWIKNNCT